MKLYLTPLLFLFCSFYIQAQQDSTTTYKKRVLEQAEIEFLTSYYTQDGNNAAVSGGIGTEKLTDFTPTIIVSMPVNDDDVLTVDAGFSAYTSASSSNVNPFDGNKKADPFQASSGASKSDIYGNIAANFVHSSDSRNDIVSGKLSVSTEYDYFSVGVGGSYTKLFNEKNTEMSINANVFLDTWNAIYPIELRAFSNSGLTDSFFNSHTITGNANYAPQFNEFESETRNSYAIGLGFSQILTEHIQGSIAVDVIQQKGLLSTPFQRVYFSDVADSFIEAFQLADDVERLPDSRLKLALGSRLHIYLNDTFVIRTFYRYYFDDWGVSSHTANIEVPIKLFSNFTLYPSYRYYIQSKADYFAAYETHLSTEAYYTSDYDLSEFNANQFGLGVSYTDIFTSLHIWKLGLKTIDLKYNHYKRNTGLTADIVAIGFKFTTAK